MDLLAVFSDDGSKSQSPLKNGVSARQKEKGISRSKSSVIVSIPSEKRGLCKAEAIREGEWAQEFMSQSPLKNGVSARWINYQRDRRAGRLGLNPL